MYMYMYVKVQKDDRFEFEENLTRRNWKPGNLMPATRPSDQDIKMSEREASEMPRSERYM